MGGERGGRYGEERENHYRILRGSAGGVKIEERERGQRTGGAVKRSTARARQRIVNTHHPVNSLAQRIDAGIGLRVTRESLMFRRVLLAFGLAAVAGAGHAPKKTVAILYFDNHTGSPDYDPLGKGISSMMISDLSSVPEIQLVERERMQDIVKEIDAQHTQYFDSTTSVKVGKMIGAQYVVVGSFATVKPQMRIDTRVVSVETGQIVKTAQVTGDQDKFFDLEQKLADQLIDGLGVALSPSEKQTLASQEKADRVDDVKTMADYSQALALYDRGEYVDALTKMAPVVQKAPNSMVVRLTYSEMKRRAADKASNTAKEKLKSGLGGLIKRPPL
jgi:TolB-like protein